ncbi:MAG: indole-3-glycerol phosphate synthase TrpC [Blastocatellia bacterium]|nr:indole-3-glycerol phosphate synthase TrpC [Blastocatellia bacterium]
MATTGKIKPEGVLEAGGILDPIVRTKILRLEEAKRDKPIEQIAERARAAASSRPRNLMAVALNETGRTNIIAEIKRRSPSKGMIREDFDHISTAQSYARAGAAVISVLTEEDFFGGSLSYLGDIRGQIDQPLLRKDFIFDEYQVYESAVAGAAAILLIVTILDDDLLARLIKLSAELGLDALVEVHTEKELGRATRAGARIIGVNNRDLTTFEVSLDTSVRLGGLAPPATIMVSESGIRTGADIKRLKSAGFHAFLIGEHLMRAPDPGAALAQLVEEAD